MQRIINISFIILLLSFWSCEPQQDAAGVIGAAPSNPKISVNANDPYNPVFTASADNGYTYHWDMGNGQIIKPGANSVTSYFPFSGTYNVTVIIYGEGAQSTTVNTTFTVAATDPTVATKPMWKELTGSGNGKTWVYNTDSNTGFTDYCFQTYWDLVEYPEHWKPQNSWGQCVRITPDINGEMVFDLKGGINYYFHQQAGDTGIKGTFILNTEKMTITIKNPYILDYNIACTVPSATTTGVYDI